MYMCYAHTVCTSGMQEVSSACPTGRLQLQLNFGNVQLTVRGMSHDRQYWCKLFVSFLFSRGTLVWLLRTLVLQHCVVDCLCLSLQGGSWQFSMH